jgi:hypothetical protein
MNMKRQLTPLTPFGTICCNINFVAQAASINSSICIKVPRDELLALYDCCDVFLSLHRSEALQLGVDVIATDFGGNTDFCTGPLAHPVRWRPAPTPPRRLSRCRRPQLG